MKRNLLLLAVVVLSVIVVFAGVSYGDSFIKTGSVHGEVTMVQPIIVESEDFAADLYPGQQYQHTITVSNRGNAQAVVWLEARDTTQLEIIIDPNSFVLFPGDTVTVSVLVVAPSVLIQGTLNVDVDVYQYHGSGVPAIPGS